MENTLGKTTDSLKETPKMDKWEYMDMHIEFEDRIQEMNKLGQEGWELCCSHKGARFIFKRKIQES